MTNKSYILKTIDSIQLSCDNNNSNINLNSKHININGILSLDNTLNTNLSTLNNYNVSSLASDQILVYTKNGLSAVSKSDFKGDPGTQGIPGTIDLSNVTINGEYTIYSQNTSDVIIQNNYEFNKLISHNHIYANSNNNSNGLAKFYGFTNSDTDTNKIYNFTIDSVYHMYNGLTNSDYITSGYFKLTGVYKSISSQYDVNNAPTTTIIYQNIIYQPSDGKLEIQTITSSDGSLNFYTKYNSSDLTNNTSGVMSFNTKINYIVNSKTYTYQS